jgi:predicted small lipoprotein YifL
MKTPVFAAILALSLAACGKDGPTYNPGARSAQPDARSVNPVDLAANAAANAWALKAYEEIYGKDAVLSCFAAFREAKRSGEVQTDGRGHPLPYVIDLADFLCECARGQSAEECPVP